MNSVALPQEKDKIYELSPSTTAEILTRAHLKETEIQQLTAALKEHFPVDETRYTHYFCDGIYAREMWIPAGTLVIGKIHTHESITFMLSGEIYLFSSDSGVVRVKAPQTFLSPPGTRRIAIAITDTIFTNVMHSHNRNLDELEKEFTVETPEELTLRLEN